MFEDRIIQQNGEAAIIPPLDKRTYTVDEIQDILGIGLSTAYKLVKERQFHSVKVGHRVLISRKSFDLWLDSAS